MTKTRHILSMWLLSMLLSVWVVPAWANEAQMDSLHCGDVVTISATPDRGYKFVRWSDGNTDNPRDIEITEAVILTAIYEPTCISDPVPVVWLYGQLLMVDVDSLQRLGYTFSEKEVTWYRIVGDIDVTSGENNDQRVTTGYYYAHLNEDAHQFYVVVDVGATPPAGKSLCTDKLYGQLTPAKKNNASLDTSPAELILLPNFGPPGTRMDIQGLSPTEHYTIQVFDAVGRKLEEYTSFGEEQYTIVAQRIPGYYLVQVISTETHTVLRYIVKQ